GGAVAAGGAGAAEPVVWTTRGTARDVVVRITEGHITGDDGEPAAHVDWGGPQALCSVCHSTWSDTSERGYGFGGSDGSGGQYITDWHYQHWHGVFDSCQYCHGHGQVADSHNFYVSTWDRLEFGCNKRCHLPFPHQFDRNLPVGANEDTACVSCGDTKIERFEECDDGNQIDGDGCSNECKLE
ncbi:MAG: DUF4215 domain-containing protein, partial [Deltaproteobacteria bacterium]|nr:DUF4215 domain-containing protein [Deltaproteobacteria bacterium]MBW2533853.1 DUF4215 domain-containing protein [Deltaproteobacteria bacterium]